MKKITDLRKEKGISQRELASTLNVTQASVSKWENNQLSISGKNLVKLAKFFEVSADSLLNIEPNKEL